MINAKLITLAREAEGLTQSALAHAVGISQAQISKIEHGFDEPSVEIVEKIADECAVPVAFFSQTDQPLGDSIVDFFHRKRSTLPAKPLNRAHASVHKVRLQVLKLMEAVELTEVAPLPSESLIENESPAHAADITRHVWRVPNGPLPNLVALLEAAGIAVVRTDLGHEKLAAISTPGLGGRSMIVINSRLPASSQRFTLAHELGHLVMHNGVASTDMEKEADQFASAFLMPDSDIKAQLDGVRFRDLGQLKMHWRVSIASLIVKAHDLGCITDRQYRTFWIQLNALPGGKKNEPGEFSLEEPRLLKSVIDHYRNDLGYSDQDIADVMVMNRDDFDREYLGQTVGSVLRPVGRTLHSIPTPKP